ncbi:hypothetical protein SAMN05216388_1006103 [Halorientalis persicus]|jgi:hypothetical protein|uniref:Uncharacterized protein n=1 Tax=Halorientalis persicus TaxID=1367881 RepID=A0A1H8KMX5_9EURY|nr:hypothetical protein [Halorientalis persicus]SEN93758.1 hypothetical protein SAMN05216388_1006103 [Halorientalis persicus]
MPSIGNRQVIVAILLAATMVLAGCSGGGGPATTEAPDDESTDANTTTGGEMTASVEGETSAEGDIPAVDYQWQEGESYTYESEASQGSTSEYSWTVSDVSDGQVTAELSSGFGSQTQTSTLTGPQGDVFSGSSDNLQAFTFVLMQIPQLVVQGQELSPGNTWTVSSSEFESSGLQGQSQPRDIDVSVTGTSQVAGTQCYNVEATGGNQTISGCVKEGWPFALSATFELQTQTTTGGETQTSSYVLVDYNRP